MSHTVIKDTFRSSDRIHSIFYEIVMPEGPVKGIIQIAHGMNEYFERYLDFAYYMADHGFIVCGNDHLGHGNSVKNDDELGYFSPEKGWQNAVRDMFGLTRIMKRFYRGIPYFLYGHSMGSFFSRAYSYNYSNALDGVIFSGTRDSVAGIDNLSVSVSGLIKRYGDMHRSDRINGLAVKFMNMKITDPQSNNEWVSRDFSVAEKMENDPKCNFLFTMNGYENLIGALNYVSHNRWYDGYNKSLPTLVMAGDMDPVGNYGKGPYHVFQKLSEENCNVRLKLYGGARHELINEINKKEVYRDILGFCESVINSETVSRTETISSSADLTEDDPEQ